MKKLLAIVLAACLALTLVACGGAPSSTPASGSASGSTAAAVSGDANVAVFYYTYSDTYISSVRSALDAKLDEMGVTYQDFDGAGQQTTQTEQVKTAITNGATVLLVNLVETASDDAANEIVSAAKDADIPVIFFNREVSNDVVNSYEKCAFVGTDAAEAGHLQGQMIGNYLLENYEACDLNGDGKISYIMFKGQEGNPEAEYRTQYGVEDANAVLEAAGKPALKFYDDSNADKYLVDTTGAWSAQAATDYMNTILGQYNDGMAEGAISALQTAGYNLGNDADGNPTSTVIPVFGVDATDSAKQLINEGKMTGTIKQDADGMASTIITLVENVESGAALMDNTSDFNVDEGVAKIRVPYGTYTGEEG